MAAVIAPDTAGGGGETGLTGVLAQTHLAAVPLLSQTFLHTGLLPPGLLQPPHLAAPGLDVPDTLDAVSGLQTALPLQEVAALPRAEPHQVVLGLPVEAAVDVNAGVVEDRGVTEPVQVGAEVPGDGSVQAGPGVTEDVVGEELLAVALGALAVLGVVVSVATEHQHQALVDAGTVEISEAGAAAQHLPLPFLVVEGVETVGELGHTAGHADVAAVHEDQVGQLVQHRAVAVAALHWVALGLYDGPLPVAEVILLHSVEVAELRAVAEDDDHSVLDDGGGVASAVDLPAQRAQALPSLGRLLVPGLGLQVEAPELLADVAGPHDPAVHEYLVVMNHRTVAVPLTGLVFVCGSDEVPLPGLQVPPGQHAGGRGPVEELPAHHPHAAAPHEGAVTGPAPLGAGLDQTCPLTARLHGLPPAGLNLLTAVLAPPAALALANFLSNITFPPPLLAAAPAVIRAGQHLTGRALHVSVALAEAGGHITGAPATAGLLVVVTGAAVN